MDTKGSNRENFMKTENAGKAATEFISKLNYKNTKMLNHSELSVFFVNFVVKKQYL
jgi:hypothetical protein